MTRTFPPVPGEPGEFESVFARGGWEAIERVFGKRSDVHRKWIALTGAKCRRPKRAVAGTPGGGKLHGGAS